MLEWDILNYLKKWRTNLRATITKIENGEININFQKLYAILEVLGLELSLKIKNKEGHL
ncbi:helix-turn-helix domain-containing protein [Bacteroides fragilis]|uniref:helix-turn-helix domain-containing protein n=1 Tax=Bacteroides fragilis TaxID=817 RepID=UPI0021D370D1|nr:helix-turn-helix domain-containing protein [Bacteroides fragilis]